jgi:ABC-type bacteriocin/lantibiotic exporter with double-glycine peptidase domain
MKLNVPYMHQTGAADCWHAAVRMIFGYKRGVSMHALDSVYKAGTGLSPSCAAIADLAKQTGMMPVPAIPVSYTGPLLENLLVRYGPLWLPLQGKGGHIMVITGVERENIYLNDPGGGTPAEYQKKRDFDWFNQYFDRSVGMLYLP